jgi:hypothetical protein
VNIEMRRCRCRRRAGRLRVVDGGAPPPDRLFPSRALDQADDAAMAIMKAGGGR